MILIERLERKKVNMKKENKLCGNDYIYIGLLLSFH